MADSTLTYDELTVQLSQIELDTMQPLVAAYNTLQTAVQTAVTALAGGTGTTQAQVFVRNSTNSITSLLQQGNAVVTTLQTTIANAQASSSSGSSTSTSGTTTTATPTQTTTSS